MQGDDIIFSAPLDASRVVDLKGPLGLTRLEIGNGSARVTASPCPYKVCIGMGKIGREGEIVACVPNRLLLQVVGTGDDEKEKAYDLLSR